MIIDNEPVTKYKMALDDNDAEPLNKRIKLSHQYKENTNNTLQKASSLFSSNISEVKLNAIKLKNKNIQLEKKYSALFHEVESLKRFIKTSSLNNNNTYRSFEELQSTINLDKSTHTSTLKLKNHKYSGNIK